MIWLLAIVAAYLAGTIPFGLLIGRWHGIDIRQHGSKNIGATNVGRVLGRKAGSLCFALDVLKGALPVLIVGMIVLSAETDQPLLATSVSNLTAAEMMLWLGVAMAAVIGHMYSLFLGFAGGKGVATGFGALVAMWPLLTVPVLGALVVWVVMLRTTKYVSVASMTAAVSVPIFLALWLMADGTEVFSALFHAWPPLLLTVLFAILVIYKHRGNIARLRRGQEPKHGQIQPRVKTHETL